MARLGLGIAADLEIIPKERSFERSFASCLVPLFCPNARRGERAAGRRSFRRRFVVSERDEMEISESYRTQSVIMRALWKGDIDRGNDK